MLQYLARVEEMMDRLGNAKVFSKMDLKTALTKFA